MEKVSLYIPCYNAQGYLKKCLESVLQQTHKIEEVLVIDDGSTDKTLEIARDYPVKVIRHSRNKGLAAARNTAFRESHNEFIAALDADCVASAEWLAELMRCFTNANIAGVGGRLLERNTAGPADKWRARHMTQAWGEDILYDPPFLYGNNSVFRKSAVLRAGRYNEEFRTNYEDIDLSERVYWLGLRMVYNPAAIVEHMRRDTFGSLARSYWLRQWYYLGYHELGRKNAFRRIALRAGGPVECLDTTMDFLREDLRLKDYGSLLIGAGLAAYCSWQGLKELFGGVYLSAARAHV